MEKTLISKRAMFEQIMAFFSSQPGLLNANPRLNTAVQAFGTNLVAIDAHAEVQVTDITGITQNKNNLLEALIAETTQMAKLLKVYAVDQADVTLIAQLAISKTSLTALPDAIIVDYTKNIIDAASPLQQELLNLGYSQQEWNDLQQLWQNAKNTLPKKEEARDKISGATQGIDNMAKANMDLLRNTIDLIMQRYKKLDSSLYAAYKLARKINKNRIQKNDIENPPVA